MTGTKGRKTHAGVIHKHVCTSVVARAHAHAHTHGKTCCLFLQSISVKQFHHADKKPIKRKMDKKKKRKKERKKEKERKKYD